MSDIVSDELEPTAVKVVGLSGDRGKFTVSRFCDAVLRANGLNPHPLSSLRFGSTSPGLETLLRAGHNAITVSVPSPSPHSLDVAIFAGLRSECIDCRETFDKLFPAIEDLFRSLDYSADRVPFAIVNRDDFFGVGIIEGLKVPHISYGTGPGAHVRATNIQMGTDRCIYDLETPLGDYSVSLKMAGHFNVLHSLAAIAMGLALRLKLEVILAAVAAVENYHGRYEASMMQAQERKLRAA